MVVTATLNVVERIGSSSARKGNASCQRVTGGADLTTKPIQLVGMRKGSMFVRGVAPKGLYAVQVVVGGMRKPRPDNDRKERLSSPQDKRYVVCCILYSKRVRSNCVSTSL